MGGADRQNNGKFFAAIAGQRVHGAYAFGQGLSHGLQHHVARDVAMRVIDLLEVINVQHEQQRRFARACHAVHLTLNDGAEMAAVGKPREGVAQRQLAQTVNQCLQVMGGSVRGKANLAAACACHQIMGGGKAQIAQKHGLMRCG